MSTRKKRIQKILQNRKNVSFEEIDRVLRDFGYIPSQPAGGSSHFTYRKKGFVPITIPRKRPFIKEHYVKEVIRILDLEEWNEQDH